MIKIIIPSLMFLTACTYSITQVHTEGQATDVVDAVSTPSNSITVPAL